MKNYNKLDKEEKIKVKKEFLEKGDINIYSKANKIIILCIIGIILAIGSFLFDYFFHAQVISFVIDGLLFAFSIFMMIKLMKIKDSEINKFLNNKKKK